MSEYSNETLTALLEEVKDDIVDGFKGVHSRQDKTNGNVVRNSDEIKKLNLWKATLTGSWIVLAAIISFVAYKAF